MGYALGAISVYAGVGAGRQQRVFQAIAQRSDARAVRHQILARQFRSFSHAYDARNIFGARAAIAFVMATVELRFERRAGANVERASALRPVNFVGGNGEQVHAEAVYVERHLSGGLHGVAMQQNFRGGGDAANFFDRLDGAELVVGVHHADENRFGLERAANFFRIDDAFAADGNIGDIDAEFFERLR